MSIIRNVHIGELLQKAAKFLAVSATIIWTSVLFAQAKDGEVSHWEDGSSMGCTYIFMQEPFYEWDQNQPPPVDIQTAIAIAQYQGESKNLQNVSVKSFRLIGVLPHGHDYPMLVMFVNYSGFPPAPRIIYSNDHHWLAITPAGTIVEPVCE